MPVKFINSVKSDFLPPKEIIRKHFCPKDTIADIERALLRIKMQAVPKPLPVLNIEEFKCTNCGHDKLSVPPTEYPSHKSCMKCGLVYPVIYQGKAYRDIKEREDRNTCGVTNDLMSEEYNASDVANKRLHSLTSRDTHIMKAKAEFDDISAKLHFNTTPSKAMNLYCSFLDGIAREKKGKVYYTVNKADMVYAACMFHCLTVPQKYKRAKYNKYRAPRKKTRPIHKRPYMKTNM